MKNLKILSFFLVAALVATGIDLDLLARGGGRGGGGHRGGGGRGGRGGGGHSARGRGGRGGRGHAGNRGRGGRGYGRGGRGYGRGWGGAGWGGIGFGFGGGWGWGLGWWGWSVPLLAGWAVVTNATYGRAYYNNVDNYYIYYRGEDENGQWYDSRTDQVTQPPFAENLAAAAA